MLERIPDIEETRYSAKRGMQFGAAAGLVFGLAATVGAILVGYGALMPLRLSASILLGQAAMDASTGTIIIVGLLVHFIVSIYYGLFFGLTHERFIHKYRMKNPARISIGILFGLTVWAINLQIIARLLYPWFLEPTQGILAVLHGLFFGLPMTLMYIERERRSVGRSVPHHA